MSQYKSCVEILKDTVELFPMYDENNQKHYRISYDNFIKYFENCEEITEHDFYISSNFTYGWMPTMLKYIEQKNIEESIRLLNVVKNGKRLSENELEILKKTINNSIVGASKLLHFINPELYAIWDSRASMFLYGTTYKTNTVKRFLEYMDVCDEIRNLEYYKELDKKYEKKFDCKVSYYRAVEQMMYLNGNK